MMGEFRHLTDFEIEALVAQNNRAHPNWDGIRVGPSFNPQSFQGVIFFNSNTLNTDKDTLIFNSLFKQVYLESCQIMQSALTDCRVENGCTIISSSITALPNPLFGFNAQLKPGNEMTPTVYPDFEFSWENVVHQKFNNSPTGLWFQPSHSNVIMENSIVENASFLCNIFAAPKTRIQNPNSLINVSLLRIDEPCFVGHGAMIKNSVLASAHIDGPVLISDSQIFPGSKLSGQLVVQNSILGPHSQLAHGEITASVLGPGIGFHHRSLLIAVWWPQGLGNVASGAQVGSNHTSRAANSGSLISEGWFFGLNTTVQFPLDLTEAPFGLLGSGQRLPAGRYPFPFSLYGSRTNQPMVKPGWVLHQNLLMVFRNEMKWRQRLPSHRSYTVFRPELLNQIKKAYNLLKNLPNDELLVPENVPSLGPCPLKKLDRELGLQIYQEFFENMPNGILEKNSRFAHILWERLKKEVAKDSCPKDFEDVLHYFAETYL
jgi:hypothetical protein